LGLRSGLPPATVPLPVGTVYPSRSPPSVLHVSPFYLFVGSTLPLPAVLPAPFLRSVDGSFSGRLDGASAFYRCRYCVPATVLPPLPRAFWLRLPACRSTTCTVLRLRSFCRSYVDSLPLHTVRSFCSGRFSVLYVSVYEFSFSPSFTRRSTFSLRSTVRLFVHVLVSFVPAHSFLDSTFVRSSVFVSGDYSTFYHHRLPFVHVPFYVSVRFCSLRSFVRSTFWVGFRSTFLVVLPVFHPFYLLRSFYRYLRLPFLLCSFSAFYVSCVGSVLRSAFLHRFWFYLQFVLHVVRSHLPPGFRTWVYLPFLPFVTAVCVHLRSWSSFVCSTCLSPFLIYLPFYVTSFLPFLPPPVVLETPACVRLFLTVLVRPFYRLRSFGLDTDTTTVRSFYRRFRSASVTFVLPSLPSSVTCCRSCHRFTVPALDAEHRSFSVSAVLCFRFTYVHLPGFAVSHLHLHRLFCRYCVLPPFLPFVHRSGCLHLPLPQLPFLPPRSALPFSFYRSLVSLLPVLVLPSTLPVFACVLWPGFWVLRRSHRFTFCSVVSAYRYRFTLRRVLPAYRHLPAHLPAFLPPFLVRLVHSLPFCSLPVYSIVHLQHLRFHLVVGFCLPFLVSPFCTTVTVLRSAVRATSAWSASPRSVLLCSAIFCGTCTMVSLRSACTVLASPLPGVVGHRYGFVPPRSVLRSATVSSCVCSPPAWFTCSVLGYRSSAIRSVLFLVLPPVLPFCLLVTTTFYRLTVRSSFCTTVLRSAAEVAEFWFTAVLRFWMPFFCCGSTVHHRSTCSIPLHRAFVTVAFVSTCLRVLPFLHTFWLFWFLPLDAVLPFVLPFYLPFVLHRSLPPRFCRFTCLVLGSTFCRSSAYLVSAVSSAVLDTCYLAFVALPCVFWTFLCTCCYHWVWSLGRTFVRAWRFVLLSAFLSPACWSTWVHIFVRSCHGTRSGGWLRLCHLVVSAVLGLPGVFLPSASTWRRVSLGLLYLSTCTILPRLHLRSACTTVHF